MSGIKDIRTLGSRYKARGFGAQGEGIGEGGKEMTIYILRQMQLQKTIGELRALKASCFNPQAAEGGELYERVNKLIDGMISELEDNLG